MSCRIVDTDYWHNVNTTLSASTLRWRALYHCVQALHQQSPPLTFIVGVKTIYNMRNYKHIWPFGLTNPNSGIKPHRLTDLVLYIILRILLSPESTNK